MNKKIRFLVPSIIVIIILLVIFGINDLYPIGGNSIVQVDADYQFIPVLYRIYDFLHGNGNIFYDDIGFGNNLYISMIIQGSIFSPLSLLLYFTSRSNIVNFFNIIVIIKICLIGLTSYIYINKRYRVNEYYKIVFSVLYALSGWILLNYFNIMWLDAVILFPLVIMYLEELLINKKYIGYIITLAMSLMISYYISYYILLFILFYSFIYLFIKLDNKDVKEIIFRLGLSTLIAILISSFSLIPAVYQTILSSRIGSSYESSIFSNFMNKSLYLILSTSFLVIFSMMISKYKSDRKNIYCYILLFILFGIGLFVEPINLAIHMGSYWSFPYRYSFITLFILMMGCLYYIEKYDFIGIKRLNVIRIILFLILCIGLVYIFNIYYKDIVDGFIMLDFDDFDIYKKIIVIFIMFIIIILLSVSFSNKIIRYISFSIVCLLQVFMYSSFTMFYSDGYYLSKNSNMLNDNLDIDNNSIERYKMGYYNYTPDHGFIYNVNTLDNWLHILPDGQTDIYKRLGYNNTDTCIRSYGGTIFSDWLFNVGYLIDNQELNDNIYTFVDKYNEYNLYKYNYNNSFGLLYNRVDNDIDYSDLGGFELHNQIYRDLFNKDSNIIDINYYNYNDYLSDEVISINYNINEKGFLYLDMNADISYIRINHDTFVDIDKGDFIIDLGIYDHDLLIEILADDIKDGSFSLGFIKYNNIINLNSNLDNDTNVKMIDNGYDIEVNNNLDNGYLFLPINNIDGLIVDVNGKLIDIDSYMGNFVSIDLDKGINNIKVRYRVPLLRLGIIFSLIGVIGLFLVSRIKVNNLILSIVSYIYIFVCMFSFLYLYGYSFFKYFNG